MTSSLSIVQLPGSVPLAILPIGNAESSGLLAVSIPAVSGDALLLAKQQASKAQMARESWRNKTRFHEWRTAVRIADQLLSPLILFFELGFLSALVPAI